MESNNYILGRIPGSGSGIRKTYEESFFIELSYTEEDKIIESNLNLRKKLYLNKETNEIVLGKDSDEYIELEVLAILPYTCTSNSKVFYLMEVIDKRILHRHLVEERSMMERLIASNMERNTETKQEELVLDII